MSNDDRVWVNFFCPACGGTFHLIDRDKLFDGSHVFGKDFRVMGVAKENNWEVFPEEDHIQGEDLHCPECDNSYADPQDDKLHTKYNKLDDPKWRKS